MAEEGRGHRLYLEARARLRVTGVESVESFDEGSVVMQTEQGALTVRGSGLHIEELSLDGGEVLVEGTVDAMSYEEPEEDRGSFLGRLFRG